MQRASMVQTLARHGAAVHGKRHSQETTLTTDNHEDPEPSTTPSFSQEPDLISPPFPSAYEALSQQPSHPSHDSSQVTFSTQPAKVFVLQRDGPTNSSPVSDRSLPLTHSLTSMDGKNNENVSSSPLKLSPAIKLGGGSDVKGKISKPRSIFTMS